MLDRCRIVRRESGTPAARPNRGVYLSDESSRRRGRRARVFQVLRGPRRRVERPTPPEASALSPCSAARPAGDSLGRLLPHLAPERVVGQPLDVLGQAVWDGAPRSASTIAGVEAPPPILEQAPVGHVVGQGVLEGVLEIREEPRLVEELGGLEVARPAAERLLRLLRDGLEEGEGHVLADDGGGLEQPLVLGREPVDAGGQDGLGRRRDLQGLRRPRQAVGARARPPGPSSRPASGRSPRGRRGCPRSARSAGA